MSVDKVGALNAKNDALVAEGNKRAAILSELQKDRKEKNLTASMPRELHMQLVERYGTEYMQDSTIANDLKRQYPGMMCMDGDTPPPRWGKAAYRKVGGVWYKRQNDGSYALGEPPSKMRWGEDAAPTVLT